MIGVSINIDSNSENGITTGGHSFLLIDSGFFLIIDGDNLLIL